jgi:hypothetical protein
MKTKTLIASMLALATSAVVYAQSVAVPPWRLTWDDPNPAGSVTSYNVFRFVAPATYTLLGTTTSNSWPITLPPGLHTVAVTATGLGGIESPRSTNHLFGVLVAVVNLRVTQ